MDQEFQQQNRDELTADAQQPVTAPTASESAQCAQGTPVSESAQPAQGTPVSESAQPAQGTPVSESVQSAQGTQPSWNGHEYNWVPTQGQNAYRVAPSPAYQQSAYQQSAYQQPTYQQPTYQQAAYATANASLQNKAKKESRGISGGMIALLLVVCIVFSALAGMGGAYSYHRYIAPRFGLPTDGPTVIKTGGTTVVYRAAEGDELETKAERYSEVAVATAASPSVVEIRTEAVATSSFYGQYVTEGAGSGVIISADGFIITCAHVVNGAINVSVTDAGGKNYPAEIIGSDDVTDIAVLKIEGEGLVPTVIGDSEKLMVGEPAVAIGNPLGTLGGSVTNGIISALDRQIEIDGYFYTLLQTNAAINPGNSGGGLFNDKAELIGIVNAKYADASVEGLGFAIPINSAIKVAEDLMKNGYVVGRPALGVNVLEVTSDTISSLYTDTKYRDMLNYVTAYGVYFVSYAENQTSRGLEYGDLITAIDGTVVTTLSDIRMNLFSGGYEVGDTVTLTVVRIDESRSTSRRTVTKQVTVEVTLVETAKPET